MLLKPKVHVNFVVDYQIKISKSSTDWDWSPGSSMFIDTKMALQDSSGFGVGCWEPATQNRSSHMRCVR